MLHYCIIAKLHHCIVASLHCCNVALLHCLCFSEAICFLFPYLFVIFANNAHLSDFLYGILKLYKIINPLNLAEI